MGIRGFKTYMLRSYRWKEIGKDGPQLSGPLVIDAMSICYCLYDDIDWKHGGQYKELEQKCIDFVTNLRKFNIEPIFVFDGVDYKGEKGPTLVKRKQSDIENISSYLLTGHGTDSFCLPIFTRIVMSEVIREMNVPFIVADGDSDSLTASIANYHGCPVLSNDSDFFVFNVEGGYIPFESFDCKHHITGKIYNWTDFVSTFRDPDIVYLIPALASNDFISDGGGAWHDVMASINKRSSSSIFATRGKFGRARRTSGSSNRISDVVDSIRSSSSVEEFFSSCSCKPESIAIVRKNFRKAKEMYTVDKINIDDTKKSTELETATGTPLPSWILEQYRAGCFSTSILDPMILNKCMLPTTVDNPKKESSMKIGVPLRSHLYGLLKPYLKEQKIKEGMRVGRHDLQYISVGPAKLEDCQSSDQLGLLCGIFGVSPDELGQFENKWKLVALSLHYWSRNAEALTQQQIDALLFCFVVCSSEEGRDAGRDVISESNLQGRRSRQFTDQQLDSLHSFSMWQCVYYEAMKLNDFLKRPLDFTSPVMFDGKICMFCACLEEIEFDGIKASMMVTGSPLECLYKNLMNVCKLPQSTQ
ncbi:PREDICTED: protein asteroid homolog 1-like [Amphimedon queenslandica]|uniref:Asteroid domain-containing protein n=1 Tax=Amphimedon queenslandica TaxID=400682 RepID=A0A1X7T941_AMPQE|nr:PREDICTED: protein asteroid homolog 1-like [Amphimedon queenslandica]|eukprot:XP_011408022.1 PREDICTED: protein asteroid homolog 1-like [Amphimedon queenslandica]